MTAWIRTINPEDAEGRLDALYQRIARPGEKIDNILLAHSLRPHTLEGHMSLYKNVLHHTGNTVEKWFLEALGVYTSMLNYCDYCVEHHYRGLVKLIGDEGRGNLVRSALEQEDFESEFSGKESAALSYAKILTLQAYQCSEGEIEFLREAGWSDGEILEINQVVAYFNYANRTVLGLGVDLVSDVLGLSPSGSGEDDWHHG